MLADNWWLTLAKNFMKLWDPWQPQNYAFKFSTLTVPWIQNCQVLHLTLLQEKFHSRNLIIPYGIQLHCTVRILHLLFLLWIHLYYFLNTIKQLVSCEYVRVLKFYVNNIHAECIATYCIIYSIEETVVHLMFVVWAIRELFLAVNFCRFMVHEPH